MKKETLTDLDYLGLIAVKGEGAKKLLQGQLTCNLDEVIHSENRLGAHCNPQGRILSLFRIFQFHETYYLQMPRESISEALAALKKYAVFFKVELSDESEDFFQLGYSGDDSSALLAALPNDIFIVEIDSKRRIFIGKKIDLKSLPITLTENNAWHIFDIQKKIPAIYPETVEKFLPHEINLHELNGISFNKGCFTGQEIIARMQYRGKLKTHLYRAITLSPVKPQRGAEIYSETGSAGQVVDFAEVGYNGYLLLVIAKEQDVTTTPLFLDAEHNIRLEFEEP